MAKIRKAGERIKRGIYGAGTKMAGTIDEVVEDAAKTGKALIGRLTDAYKNVANTFFPEGRFDYERTQEMLQDSAEVVREFGEKAYHTLVGIVAKGAEAVSQDYHRYIPTAEELNTTYKGIGKAYNGFLFRENYENCLAFSKKAVKEIPRGARYKLQILNDIKASASANKDELIKFYANQMFKKKGESQNYVNKIRAVDKYL